MAKTAKTNKTKTKIKVERLSGKTAEVPAKEQKKIKGGVTAEKDKNRGGYAIGG